MTRMIQFGWRPLACLCSVALLTACSAGDGGGAFGSFGSPANGNPGSGPADDPNAMESGGEDTESEQTDSVTGDGGQGGSTSDAPMGTTGGDDGTPPPMGDSSGGGDMGSSSGGAAGSSDGAMGNPGDQPANGMYAHCVEDDFTNCGAADTCIFLDATEGFCSTQGCTNAAVDCDPAPVGTSVTPICADAVSTAVCALDCSAAACPTGMTCTTVSINMGPDVDVCV